MLSASFYVILLAVGILAPIYYGIVLRDDPTFKKMVSTFLVKMKNRT
jgi:hypothetical protein